MEVKNWILGAGVCLLAACSASNLSFEEKALEYCDRQVHRTLEELRTEEGGMDYTMMPRNIMDSLYTWHCRKAVKEEWCSGFWPGVLWYDYEYTGDKKIREEAEKFTASLKFLSETPAFDHDLGFLVFCSYGNGYRLTHNPEYKRVILAAADTLATLYRPQVGTILSWPRNVEMFGGHNTIMDNMINLEMLMWASKNGGSPALADIAVSHADKTMKYQFRDDYTSYHVAVYDTLTGEFIKGVTHQGYADNSMWARGQAWAIYGYTVMYRETKEVRYLVNVLRLKPGDRITARDRTNRYYDATIMEGGSLILSPVERPQSSLSDGLSGYRGPMPSIHLYQCICKGRKNEDIARMACEAGVEKLVFISSAYTQEKELKRHSIERIEAIMREAVQQSGSESGTEIGMMTFAQALDEAPGRILLLHQSVLSRTKSLFEALDGLRALVVVHEDDLLHRALKEAPSRDIPFPKSILPIYGEASVLAVAESVLRFLIRR